MPARLARPSQFYGQKRKQRGRKYDYAVALREASFDIPHDQMDAVMSRLWHQRADCGIAARGYVSITATGTCLIAIPTYRPWGTYERLPSTLIPGDVAALTGVMYLDLRR